MTQPIVFISYHHADEVEKDQLLTSHSPALKSKICFFGSGSKVEVLPDWCSKKKFGFWSIKQLISS